MPRQNNDTFAFFEKFRKKFQIAYLDALLYKVFVNLVGHTKELNKIFPEIAEHLTSQTINILFALEDDPEIIFDSPAVAERKKILAVRYKDRDAVRHPKRQTVDPEFPELVYEVFKHKNSFPNRRQA